jgi:hypothetical protein
MSLMVSLIAIFEFFRIPGICSALVVLGGAISGFWAAWDLPYAWPSTARVVGGSFSAYATELHRGAFIGGLHRISRR